MFLIALLAGAAALYVITQQSGSSQGLSFGMDMGASKWKTMKPGGIVRGHFFYAVPTPEGPKKYMIKAVGLGTARFDTFGTDGKFRGVITEVEDVSDKNFAPHVGDKVVMIQVSDADDMTSDL